MLVENAEDISSSTGSAYQDMRSAARSHAPPPPPTVTGAGLEVPVAEQAPQDAPAVADIISTAVVTGVIVAKGAEVLFERVEKSVADIGKSLGRLFKHDR
jgi:hypothetical protein